jgi:hypothetical protein
MLKAGSKLPAMDRERAETLAVQALGFLAEDGTRWSRFLQLTGLDAAEMRGRAGAPEFLAAVLSHLAQDESLLLVFAASRQVAPETIAPAISMLQDASR